MLTRVDGTLLKPDRPATPLDSYWSVRAFGASAQAPQGELGPRGELWTTETTLGGGSYTWHYAFGLMLDAPYHLSGAELVASGQAWPDNTHTGVSLDHRRMNTRGYVAWRSRAGVGSAQGNQP